MDLDPAALVAETADVRVVGLGEGTHGTEEFFRARSELTLALVATGRFPVVALEAEAAPVRAVDDYVQHGVGDPAALARELGGWTWGNPDFTALLESLRAMRLGGHAVRLVGIDVQDEPLVAWADAVDAAAGAPAEVQAQLAALVEGRRYEIHTFAPSLGAEPVDLVVTARLGVDAPARVSVLCYDGRGAQVSTYWRGLPAGRAADLSLEVPATVALRGLMCGWIATPLAAAPPLVVRSEFVRVADSDGTLLDALGPEVVRSELVRVPLEEELRTVERVEELLAGDFPAVADALELGAMAARLQDRASDSPRDAQRLRDALMADRVLALAEGDRGVVLWAHNAHVARVDDAMGAVLGAQLGAGYLPVGLTTGTGAYRASRDGVVAEFPLAPPWKRSLELHLADAPTGSLVDLRTDVPELGGSFLMRSIGARAELVDRWQFRRVPRDAFDLVLWIAETHPTVVDVTSP